MRRLSYEVGRLEMSEEIEETEIESCSICGGQLAMLGKLGAKLWLRCMDCGMEWSRNE